MNKSYILALTDQIATLRDTGTGLLLYNKLGFLPYEIEKRYDRKSFPIALIKMKKELQKPM
jgi:hypothetical protein